MARYRRINIDGCSLFKTETRLLKAAAFPGTAVFIDTDDQFAISGTSPGGTNPRLYVLDEAWYLGGDCMTQIPADNSVIGNYLEEGREFAVRMAPGTYRKDQAVYVAPTTGIFTLVPATSGTYLAVGYVQEEQPVTTTETDLIRIRVQAHVVVNP